MSVEERTDFYILDHLRSFPNMVGSYMN